MNHDPYIRDRSSRHRGSYATTGAIEVLFAVALAPSIARAQAAEMQGRVLSDSGRRPLPNAEVAIQVLELRAISDSLGRYRLLKVPRGTHTVVTRAVGFRPDTTITTFDGDETLISDVVLKPPMSTLPTV